MKRFLNNTFITDLLEDNLKELLSYVKKDNTLDIEIRGNYISIYYRGGNALKVSETNVNKYDFHFDRKYLETSKFLSEDTINSFKLKSDWDKYFPLVKQAMDFYFTKLSKDEREFQQLVVRENNYSTIANSTDYFILDIEYDNRKNARFDIVAIEWESEASIRKLMKGYKPKLVVIEMKYGDGALQGNAGIQKHIRDFEIFISNRCDVDEFKIEMLNVFRQKRQLGLIPCLSDTENSNEVICFSENIEMMFLFANHDPASSILKTELDNLTNKNIKFITSNFFGYGLFKQNVFNYNQFLDRFKSQI
ncbi:MAG: hypothetical protein ISS16_01010 [Ignavibacteria bacterium]|nr:hypothetical protein [Ignavibacteria bacterium]